ncbi:MAG TPA: cupin domain-containing protein [Nocardioides sp.]|nr:cupin domain-containing protein [Nocardioides sp.]
MPSANEATTPVAVEIPQMTGRYAELDGFTVGFESYPVDVDPAPFFQGLPDDRCQCPHWGIVTAGEITFRWADTEETYRAGDAYYAGPGHLPVMTAGTSVVEFSPTSEAQKTVAVVEANLARAGADA